MIQLYNDDCFNIFPSIKDKSIDLILCDLPYGVTNNKSDIKLPLDELWNQYERIIKTNGAIILFAQGIFYVDLVNSNRKLFRYDIIWDKKLVSGFLNSKRMPLRQHEQIAVFYKKLPTYNPQMRVGMPSHSKGTLFKYKPVINNNYGQFSPVDIDVECDEKYPTSIIACQKPHPSVTVHRTQKPVDLLLYLIKTYSNENDLVLDNCMGSGSTGVACKMINRNFIGIEIDKHYFDIAKERIENGGKNKLF